MRSRRTKVPLRTKARLAAWHCSSCRPLPQPSVQTTSRTVTSGLAYSVSELRDIRHDRSKNSIYTRIEPAGAVKFLRFLPRAALRQDRDSAGLLTGVKYGFHNHGGYHARPRITERQQRGAEPGFLRQGT